MQNGYLCMGTLPCFSAIFTKGNNLSRVHTEIRNQYSRTFPGLFKDYLHFFQESSFIDSNLPNTADTIVHTFPFRAHCFCLISALHIVSARYFRFCLPPFPLCKVSLPVALDSYYLNQIE